MQRYAGSGLSSQPKIAVLANDAIGNFAMSTPLLQALRVQHPNCRLDFYGGTRTEELELASLDSGPSRSPLLNWRTAAQGTSFPQVIETALARRREIEGYDLIVNLETMPAHKALAAALASQESFVCGPCIGLDSRDELPFLDDERGRLWLDQNWVDADLCSRFPFLHTGFISEIFIRLCYIEPIEGAPWPGGVPKYWFPTEKPPIQTPEVIIATGASLSTKLWPVQKWIELLGVLRNRDIQVGLVGAPPRGQKKFYHSNDDEGAILDRQLAIDLRGRLSLPQVSGALAQARLVITIDNGILHLAAAHEVPTIGLFRPRIANLWAPPNPNLVRISAEKEVAEIELSQVLEAWESLSATSL